MAKANPTIGNVTHVHIPIFRQIRALAHEAVKEVLTGAGANVTKMVIFARTAVTTTTAEQTMFKAPMLRHIVAFQVFGRIKGDITLPTLVFPCGGSLWKRG
ncbi:hypothetical protein O1611_g8962 [Lasiodiplodia mahajangana]|uniref:Uncharacterized protein n=1 Tax=Lasiodiplodia mahajangana TaxID=1108764 RepID=A0ACC2JBX8_9PEZI|nr:hypothetical protein O1611_g8962 [Lasiodiplodia mahajangana]